LCVVQAVCVAAPASRCDGISFSCNGRTVLDARAEESLLRKAMSQLVLQLAIMGLFIHRGKHRDKQADLASSQVLSRLDSARILLKHKIFALVPSIRGVKPCLVSQCECTSVSRYGDSEVRENTTVRTNCALYTCQPIYQKICSVIVNDVGGLGKILVLSWPKVAPNMRDSIAYRASNTRDCSRPLGTSGQFYHRDQGSWKDST
jgi:hypothetical protein